MEIRRHTISSFALDTLDPNCLLEKLDAVFSSPECAANPNVAFGFVLKNVEDASCRYSDANENTTLFGQIQTSGYQRQRVESQESTE